MIPKKIIQEKIDNLTEEQLDKVYKMIEELSISEDSVKKPSLMSEVQKISINAPEDFSVKLAMSFGRDVSEE